MPDGRNRSYDRSLPLSWLLICLVQGWASAALAAEPVADILLKNGTTLHGTFLVANQLSDRFTDIPGRSIGRIDTGWQRFYFPVRQREERDAKQQAALATARPVIFDRFPKPIRSGNGLVTQFGALRAIEPFDEWGHRRLEILTEKGVTPVFQAITEATPDHVIVTSTNFDWKLGQTLKTIPIETLDKMLRKQFKPDDVNARFVLVRFYSQAEYYLEAFAELEAIGREFPAQQALVANAQGELLNYFGKEILRRLARRERAGQHKLAEMDAITLRDQQLTGPVKQDVEEYVKKYEEAKKAIDRAKLLLGDWQAKLTETDRVNRIQPLRSEINEQLDFETLPRLDAFLKAESDNQYEPQQRLGLAYTGWLLGAANAEPDLDQALRVWEARRLVMDYLHSDDAPVQIELVNRLGAIENFSAEKVLSNLIAQLPPILDASGIDPGVTSRVVSPADSPVAYWVNLPAEYSPHHQYPLLIAMRPGYRSAEETASGWAGNERFPDFGNQRGYIVIAPEYAPNGAAEYSFGATAHKYVLDCLIDARKRFSVDSNRVFLAGHGMGADAAFDIGIAHPDEFAGVLPLGGNAINYVVYCWENGAHTAWYVVGKGYDSNGARNDRGDRVYNNMFQHGFKFDFMLVEYLGRNGETLFDEIPKLYDWMDLHERKAPPRQFAIKTMRKTDNRIFWVTAAGLPRDYVLPAPADDTQRISPMNISASIIQPGNLINLKSDTKNYTLRLSPDLVDFSKRLKVKVGDRVIFNDFVTPDTNAILQELQSRGDRTRLPLAVINP